MTELTPKRQEIYNFIVAFQRNYGYAPSVREIGLKVGLKSPSTVHFHLKHLMDVGLISQKTGKTRTIVVNGDVQEQPVAPVQDKIPLVGSVAAGTPILAEECIEEYIAFPVRGPVEEHFALTVRGESMRDAGILPGDLVIVRQQVDFHNGEIVVALFEDEATVKTFWMEKGHLWLLPENPDYAPIDGEGCQLLGKVVGVQRHYR